MIAKIFRVKLDKKKYGLHEVKFVMIESTKRGEITLEIDGRFVDNDWYDLSNITTDYIERMYYVLEYAQTHYMDKGNEIMYNLISAVRNELTRFIDSIDKNMIDEYFSVIQL